MKILIHGVYTMQNVYFLKCYHQKSRSIKFSQKTFIRVQPWFSLLQHGLTLPQLITVGGKYIIYSQVEYRLWHKNTFIIWCYLPVMFCCWNKMAALKVKYDCSFWSSEKCCKGFSKTNYIIRSSLQKCIISHPCVIQYPIEKYYITVNFMV